jgi:Tfp pilus assembly protein PilX
VIRYQARGCRSRQGGIALIVVLLLLLLVTILGLAAMRGALLQERMSGNMRARSIAFQTAESVLREAEQYVAQQRPAMPAAGSGCTGGLCGMAVAGAAPAWEAAGFWDSPTNYRTSNIQGDDQVLGYVIEDMGKGEDVSDDCTTAIDLSASVCSTSVQRYRITAFARLANGAEVLLQSRFQVQ